MRRIWPFLLAVAAAFTLTSAPAHALQPIEPIASQLRLTQQGVDGAADEDVLVPDVVYNSRRGEFLAVWQNRFVADEEIFGRRLATDGTPIGPAFQITGLSTDAAGFQSERPSVAYDFERDRYAVAYTGKLGAEGREVLLQLVSATGSPIKLNGTAGPEPLPMSSVGPPGDDSRGVLGGPALAYRPDASGDGAPGDRWVVAYSGDEVAQDDFDIMVSAIDAENGASFGGDKVITDPSTVNGFSPTLAPMPNSDEVAVAWQGSLGPSDVEIFARRVSPALTTTGPQLQVTATGDAVHSAGAPDLAADTEHNQLLVAYQARKTDAEGLEAHVQRLNLNLGQIGTDDQQVSSAGPPGSGAAFTASPPAAAYLPNLDRFLVTWIGNDTDRPGLSNDEKEVMATVLDPAGVEGDPQDFTISRMGVDNDEDAAPANLAVAADTQTGRWLSVWSSDDGRASLADDEFELFGRQVGENFDRDGDGAPIPQDCDDANGAVHPGATDLFDNGLDEDCTGADAENPDRDGDGSARPADCDDANPFIRPGAVDIPSNGVSEDCVDGDAQLPPKPLEVTRATVARFFEVFREFTIVTRLQVNNVRPGMRIELRCTGRGCPKPLRKTVRKVTVRNAGSLKFTRLFKTAKLRPKAAIELRVLETGAIARVDRFIMRDRKNPRQLARCLPPGATKPGACPR